MLNVYSRARDGETLLSRSFRAKEFACKDGTDGLGRYPATGFVHVDVRKAKSRWAG